MRVSIVSRAMMVVGACALMACGSPSPSSNGGSAGTGSSVAGTSTGGAGGVPANTGGAGTSGGSGEQATTTTHFGQVMLQSLVGGSGTVSVNARFQSGLEPGTEAKCTRVSDGPCTASICDEAPAGGTKPIFASAGTVTVTSTEVSGTATLLPDATNQYPTTSTSPFEEQFLGGEHVQFKASGATVPAFEGEVGVPLVLLLSQPLFVKGQPSLDAPRSQDLSLVWTRGVKDVYLYLAAGSVRPDGLPGRAYLTCQIPSETGSTLIKSSLLQQLATDTAVTPFTIGAKIITAGQYSITLATTLPTANPDKDLIPRIVLK